MSGGLKNPVFLLHRHRLYNIRSIMMLMMVLMMTDGNGGDGIKYLKDVSYEFIE